MLPPRISAPCARRGVLHKWSMSCLLAVCSRPSLTGAALRIGGQRNSSPRIGLRAHSAMTGCCHAWCIKELEREGFQAGGRRTSVLDAGLLAPDRPASAAFRPDAQARSRYRPWLPHRRSSGWARSISGRPSIVQQGMVLGVEASRGHRRADPSAARLLKRDGPERLCWSRPSKRGSGAPRFDLPTIGPADGRSCRRMKPVLRGIAVEAWSHPGDRTRTGDRTGGRAEPDRLRTLPSWPGRTRHRCCSIVIAGEPSGDCHRRAA